MRPIAVTGVGMVTPMGLNLEQTWRGIIDGRTAIGPLTQIEPELQPDKTGGEAPPLPDDFCPNLPRESRYLKFALEQALAHAHATSLPYSGERCGMVIGTTLHGIRAAGRYFRTLDPAQFRTILAAQTIESVAHGLGIHGATYTTCAACSSGLASIAMACSMLSLGELDLVIAGGYDVIAEYAYAGFNSLRLIADGPIRPFTVGRQGMKVSEGYGLLVLERAEDAAKRDAKIFAHLLGVGESSDAHHLTQPHPQGLGAAAAIKTAIAQSGLTADEIDLVAAHATGTPDNDAGEAAALREALGDAISRVPVTAFKSHLGHTLGGAGAVELILAIKAAHEKTLPPIANISPESIEFPELQLVRSPTRAERLRAVATCSLGFGGANTCVVAAVPHEVSAPVVLPHPRRTVCITGVGVVFPNAIGADAFRARLSANNFAMSDSSLISDDDLATLLNARRIRRMSKYVRLSLASVTLALRQAGVEAGDLWCQSASAVMGSTHASVAYLTDFYEQIVREGFASANPLLFAEGVPNAGSAHVSLAFGLRGLCQAVIGSRTAGLDALRLACTRIASGDWSRAVVGAGEEFTPIVALGYRSCGLYRDDWTNTLANPFDDSQGFSAGDGSVALVVESIESAHARGAKPLAILRHCDATSYDPQNPRQSLDALTALITRMPEMPHVVSSANGTRLAALELAAISRVARTRNASAEVGAMVGHFQETFSATPMAALAAVILSRRIPRALNWTGEIPRGLTAVSDREISGALVLASDYAGQSAGAAIDLVS